MSETNVARPSGKLHNEVHISGFVATEPQQSGRGPYRFRLSHGGGKKKDGTEWPRQFFSVAVWDTKSVPKKGERIEIWGKLRQNEYTDKNGNKRDGIEIIAESVQAQEQPAKVVAAPPTTSGKAIADAILRPTEKNIHNVEVSDDDLPW